MLLLVGLGIGYVVLYYVVFIFVICVFNLKILGCEDESVDKLVLSGNELVGDLVVVFGGKVNIINLDVCIICLCVLVVDIVLVD